jgi:hypothetical protein
MLLFIGSQQLLSPRKIILRLPRIITHIITLPTNQVLHSPALGDSMSNNLLNLKLITKICDVHWRLRRSSWSMMQLKERNMKHWVDGPGLWQLEAVAQW